jgi:predicted neutral ceramidase superfamily lipid hydrolase
MSIKSIFIKSTLVAAVAAVMSLFATAAVIGALNGALFRELVILALGLPTFRMAVKAKNSVQPVVMPLVFGLIIIATIFIDDYTMPENSKLEELDRLVRRSFGVAGTTFFTLFLGALIWRHDLQNQWTELKE